MGGHFMGGHFMSGHFMGGHFMGGHFMGGHFMGGYFMGRYFMGGPFIDGHFIGQTFHRLYISCVKQLKDKFKPYFCIFRAEGTSSIASPCVSNPLVWKYNNKEINLHPKLPSYETCMIQVLDNLVI